MPSINSRRAATLRIKRGGKSPAEKNIFCGNPRLIREQHRSAERLPDLSRLHTSPYLPTRVYIFSNQKLQMVIGWTAVVLFVRELPPSGSSMPLIFTSCVVSVSLVLSNFKCFAVWNKNKSGNFSNFGLCLLTKSKPIAKCLITILI